MSQHRVKQLRNYLKGTCQLSKDLDLLEDSRQNPSYSTKTLGGLSLISFICRGRSTRQLARRGRKKGWRRFVGLQVGGPSPVEGTFRYFFPRLSTASVRAAHVSSVRRMLRSKMHRSRTLGGLRIVSVDGTQPFSTRANYCGGCIIHHSRRPHASEEELPSIWYEHKIVTARLLGDRFSPWMGYITQKTYQDKLRYEGEQTAVKGLFEQLVVDYGLKNIDVIAADALHANGPFITECDKRGWYVIFASKENASSLQKAFESSPLPLPSISSERVKEGWVKVTIWEQDGLCLTTCDVPLRVAKIHQVVTNCSGKLVREDIRWIGSTIPKDKLNSHGLWWVAWRRWETENGGHRTFKREHHAKHVFCHKNKQAVENILWLLMWAQNLLEAFGLRRLASGLFGGLTDGLIGLVEELTAGMAENRVKGPWVPKVRGRGS